MAAKKLFELLVVEPNLKTQSQQVLKELKHSFEKKRHLFEEKKKTFFSNEANVLPVLEEQSDIQTTIPDELKWISEILTKAYDTSFQVATGNTSAKADVVLDNDAPLLSNVPATALLELEKRAGELLDLFKAIPTLDPAKGFKPDEQRGKHIFVARETRSPSTKKVQKALVLYPATPEHPAQTQLVSLDELAGDRLQQEWSSLITPARKGILIERVEELRRAVKAALHRANAVELSAPSPTCGEKIFNFLLAE